MSYNFQADAAAWPTGSLVVAATRTLVNGVRVDWPVLHLHFGAADGSSLVPVSLANPLPSQMSGTTAGGQPDTGNPVKGGAVYHANPPTYGDGQRTDFQATAHGALIVAPGIDGFTVTPAAAVGSGATPYHYFGNLSTNSVVVKAAPATLYDLEVFNRNLSARFIHLYDLARTPVPGTDVPVKTLMVPGDSGGTGTGLVRSYPVGVAFRAGLAFALTTGMSDSDSGPISGGDLVLNLDYV